MIVKTIIPLDDGRQSVSKTINIIKVMRINDRYNIHILIYVYIFIRITSQYNPMLHTQLVTCEI